MWDLLKMGKNMDREHKSIKMGIDIKDNLSMDFLKASVNIFGLMAHSLKEILNRVPEMVMDFGEA